MQELEKKLNYTFRNQELLREALNHSSYANEHRSQGLGSNERLEFLGDSVLGVTVADFLYRHFPDMPEGRMTRLRAELVCETSLHKVALELGISEYMRLGRGEEHTGGRQRPSILADMVEAIIAAMYIDSGMDQAREFIMTRVLKDARIDDNHRTADYKTELQELVQRRSNQHISYELIGESGPDHCKTFTFQVCVNGLPVGEGSGRTKKEAEQQAAGRALEAMRE